MYIVPSKSVRFDSLFSMYRKLWQSFLCSWRKKGDFVTSDKTHYVNLSFFAPALGLSQGVSIGANMG